MIIIKMKIVIFIYFMIINRAFNIIIIIILFSNNFLSIQIGQTWILIIKPKQTS